MNEIKIIEMKTKDIADLRNKIWLENDKKCPVLQREILESECVLDHKHKRKDEDVSLDGGKGLLRTTLHRNVNTIMGKFENSYIRYGLHKEDLTISEFLRNCADYFEKGHYIDENNQVFVHPKEVSDKNEYLQKSSYKKLLKLNSDNPWLNSKNKPKKFPFVDDKKWEKKGKQRVKLTKPLREFFEHHNLEPKFY